METRRATFTDHAGERRREHRVLPECPLDAFPEHDGATAFEELLREVGRLADMDLVLLGHVNERTYTTVAAWARWPPPALPRGATLPIAETYCRQELTANAPFVMPDALVAGFADHPGFTRHHLRAYVGCPVVLADGTTFGTLCAVDERPRLPSSEAVTRLVEVARLIGEEIGRRLGGRKEERATGAEERPLRSARGGASHPTR